MTFFTRYAGLGYSLYGNLAIKSPPPHPVPVEVVFCFLPTVLVDRNMRKSILYSEVVGHKSYVETLIRINCKFRHFREIFYF